MLRRPKAQSVIFSTLIPLLARRYEFAYSDRSGSLGAHQDLLLFSLRHGIAKAAEIFVEGTADVSSPLPDLRAALTKALQELPKELLPKVRLSSLVDLAERTDEQPDRLFVGKIPEFACLCHLRQRLRKGFPICGLVHSVFFPNLLGTWTDILISARPDDSVVVTSCAAEQALTTVIEQTRERLCRLGVPESRLCGPAVVAIPLGVDEGWLRPVDKNTARQALGLPQDSLVLLYVGRLTPEYKADLEPLIRAASRLTRRYPSILLLMAGSEDASRYSRVLADHAAECGIADKVLIIRNFPGYVKPVLYGAADVFVSPADNMQESFGLTLLEAMASGVPVIASNWSGYRDIVLDGTTGFLVDTFVIKNDVLLGSVIATAGVVPYTEQFFAARTLMDTEQLIARAEALLDSSELRASMGAAGRARVLAQFTWRSVIGRFGTLWQEQLRRASEPEPRLPTLDVSYAIRGYPSREVDLDELHVMCPDECLETMMRKLGEQDPRLRLLRLCNQGPVRVRELIKRNHRRQAIRVIVSLIKSGILVVRS